MAHHRKDFLIPLLTVTSDVLAIEGAFLFSYWLRFYSPLTSVIPVELGFPPIEAYVYGSLFVIPSWLLLFHSRGMYRARRAAYFSDEFFPILRVVFFGMLLVMAAAFFYRAFSFSRLVFALLAVTGVVLIAAGRFVVLTFEQWWYARGHDIKNVILVGGNETARRVYESIAHHPSLGYRMVGYFTTRGKGQFSKRLPYLGSLSKVPHYLRHHAIELVLVALTSDEHPRLAKLIEEAEGLNTEIMMVPDLVELMTSRVRIKELEGIPFLQVKEAALTTWNRIVKRGFDIVVAVVILVLTSPLLGLIAAMIAMTSQGPPFYLQERVGLDGRTFNVLKFRTMRIDAEAKTGPVWAKRNDPRVTPLGKILRRLSLDELPQLFNVLKGEMSIVGPRPERPYFVKRFKDEIPKYLDRHRVKSGMTGWAQVNGLRGQAPVADRTKYDVYYVENWSLTFDLKIIFKTIRAVLFGKDAY
ncbi:MAG: undecaprenyl-phosphate glucose phosphotransferase [Ignavibacteriales bacterium]|nr:undecaprenyl-phosphate glucose phosphotransferase [Ignavibacteriales bacterium]